MGKAKVDERLAVLQGQRREIAEACVVGLIPGSTTVLELREDLLGFKILMETKPPRLRRCSRCDNPQHEVKDCTYTEESWQAHLREVSNRACGC